MDAFAIIASNMGPLNRYASFLALYIVLGKTDEYPTLKVGMRDPVIYALSYICNSEDVENEAPNQL